MLSVFKNMFDDDKKDLVKFTKVADKIVAVADIYRAMNDDELKQQTTILKERLANGETVDDILIDAFATAREAATRSLGMTPFHVQLVGGIAIAQGNISEMKTGEGKTLTATLPAYLHALTGRGVHIVTVNEYLSARDASEMGILFDFLGMEVGLNRSKITETEKREAYAKDITYSTNNELGFDYLRDNMALYKERKVQRGLHFVIIDEVDSILIDESRTPLIISGEAKITHNFYQQVDTVAKILKPEEDFSIELKSKTIALKPQGIDRVESSLGIENLYDIDNSQLAHALNNSLRANYLMHLEVDYVATNGEIVIIDQFTGRMMEGRVFSDGLHQAIEAKENIEQRKETKTVATITFQNYFRLYETISGMTGTAKTEEEEFRDLYAMKVICIPTNADIIRDDKNDIIFSSIAAKTEKIIELVREKHKIGQPILLGTVSIESSEALSLAMKKAGLRHEVLNAKNHEREADIILSSGQLNQITIATNMAGRGTDIKISREVAALGGLAIIGTERHESRRIDNQLRGRSGRQGDPGDTQFFISFEDELMRRFASPKIKSMLISLGIDDEPINNKLISRAVEAAQKKVESQNFESRKMLLKYDDIIREQRELIYTQRNHILEGENGIETCSKISNRVANSQVEYLQAFSENPIEEITNYLRVNISDSIEKSTIESMDITQLSTLINDTIKSNFDEKIENVSEIKIIEEFCRTVALKCIDEE